MGTEQLRPQLPSPKVWSCRGCRQAPTKFNQVSGLQTPAPVSRRVGVAVSLTPPSSGESGPSVIGKAAACPATPASAPSQGLSSGVLSPAGLGPHFSSIGSAAASSRSPPWGRPLTPLLLLLLLFSLQRLCPRWFRGLGCYGGCAGGEGGSNIYFIFCFWQQLNRFCCWEGPQRS